VQLSKLLHSSFDLDRLDYLLRDSHATGVPYGNIDINYLLNNLSMSPSRTVGCLQKALPAIEQFLFARFFMHQVVYYHKTTYGIEEVCRQLVRRLRDRGTKNYGVPRDGNEIREIATSSRLLTFTDAFLDDVIRQAANDKDPCIRCLAGSIQGRHTPKLIEQVSVCEKMGEKYHAVKTFMSDCRSKVGDLAKEFKLELWQFLLCETPPLGLLRIKPPPSWREAAKLEAYEIQDQATKEEEEDIRIFQDENKEPESLLSFEESLVARCASYVFQSFRLYVVLRETDDEGILSKLREAVAGWENP
jgi:hypothetical protein